MRSVLLTPNWRLSKALHFVDTTLAPITPPIEWGYLAKDSSVIIHDAYLLNEGALTTCEWINRQELSFIIISSAPNYLYWRCPPLNVTLIADYISLLRTINCRAETMIVGPHGSIDPVWTLKKTGADLVFRGEIDSDPDSVSSFEAASKSQYVVSLASAISPKAPQLHFRDGRYIDYSRIPNLTCYEPHGWGADIRQSLKQRHSYAGTLVEFARGCSYNCGFCLRPGFREKLRVKPIQSFEREIELIAKIGIRYVFFIDEDFWRPKSKYIAAVELLRRYGIGFGFQARPDTFLVDDIDFLSECGCSYIEFGSEALEIEPSMALGKFSNPAGALDIIHYAKEKIEGVFTNIFDLSRLVSLEADTNRISQFDNEGNPPSPFIAYPGTLSGDRVLNKYRAIGFDTPNWELCEALFILDSARKGFAPFVAEEIYSIASETEALKHIIDMSTNEIIGKRPADSRFNTWIEPARSTSPKKY